jgi:NAD(P)-dependent dehydrogenase (short-subunit alcohol dehydrogenase family)
MPCSQGKKGSVETNASTHRFSKEMPPLPSNFLPVFIKNQFRTEIELPETGNFPSTAQKCAIITGSNTGLGLESARQLLSLGLSRLIIAVRSLDKGEIAASQLRANSNAKIEVWQLDMESYPSIHNFVTRCERELDRIDFAILNAGISPIKFEISEITGHEKTIQVNHLSTALLATLLLPILKRKSPPGETPCLTIVNSVMAHLCTFPNRHQRPVLQSFDDTKITPWNPMERYGVSKLLCQLFLVQLAEHVSSNDVIINMVDPGLTKGTNLARDASGIAGVAIKAFNAACARPLEKGAATYVDAVLRHREESHGCFIMNCSNAP